MFNIIIHHSSLLGTFFKHHRLKHHSGRLPSSRPPAQSLVRTNLLNVLLSRQHSNCSNLLLLTRCAASLPVSFPSPWCWLFDGWSHSMSTGNNRPSTLLDHCGSKDDSLRCLLDCVNRKGVFEAREAGWCSETVVSEFSHDPSHSIAHTRTRIITNSYFALSLS